MDKPQTSAKIVNLDRREKVIQETGAIIRAQKEYYENRENEEKFLVEGLVRELMHEVQYRDCCQVKCVQNLNICCTRNEKQKKRFRCF